VVYTPFSGGNTSLYSGLLRSQQKVPDVGAVLTVILVCPVDGVLLLVARRPRQLRLACTLSIRPCSLTREMTRPRTMRRRERKRPLWCRSIGSSSRTCTTGIFPSTSSAARPGFRGPEPHSWMRYFLPACAAAANGSLRVRARDEGRAKAGGGRGAGHGSRRGARRRGAAAGPSFDSRRRKAG
jgi:hypothetical protein